MSYTILKKTIASLVTATITYTSFLSTAESEIVRFKSGEVIIGVDNIVYDELLEQANHGKWSELTSYLGKSSPYTAEEVQAGISRLILFGRESSAFYQEGMCLTPEAAWKKELAFDYPTALERAEKAESSLEFKIYERLNLYWRQGRFEERIPRIATVVEMRWEDAERKAEEVLGIDSLLGSDGGKPLTIKEIITKSAKAGPNSYTDREDYSRTLRAEQTMQSVKEAVRAIEKVKAEMRRVERK